MWDHFDGFFQTLKKVIGIDDWVSVFIRTPTSILFQLVSLPSRPQHESYAAEADDNKNLTSLFLQYVSELQRSCLSKAEDPNTSIRIARQIHAIWKMVVKKPASVVKGEANDGNPEAAFDYGIRWVILLLSFKFLNPFFEQTTDFLWAWAATTIVPLLKITLSRLYCLLMLPMSWHAVPTVPSLTGTCLQLWCCPPGTSLLPAIMPILSHLFLIIYHPKVFLHHLQFCGSCHVSSILSQNWYLSFAISLKMCRKLWRRGMHRWLMKRRRWKWKGWKTQNGINALLLAVWLRLVQARCCHNVSVSFDCCSSKTLLTLSIQFL